MTPLERFAVAVLERLEEDHDWSAETLGDIAEQARNLGLATDDDQGMFRRVGPSDSEAAR